MFGPLNDENPLPTTLPMDMNTVSGSGLTAVGVEGVSNRNNGVHGRSSAPGASGVYGDNDGGGIGIAGRSMQGVGVFGEGGRLAGHFIGRVEMTSDLTVAGDVVLAGADVAEQFDVRDPDSGVAPGWLVTLDDCGMVMPTQRAYDSRVAGVVSGAGDRKPALVLDRRDGGAPLEGPQRVPVAVVGKAWCHADATADPIEVGDMLTSSPLAGHAMKATDHVAAFGAVIGKALTPLPDGTGPVLVLVGLR